MHKEAATSVAFTFKCLLFSGIEVHLKKVEDVSFLYSHCISRLCDHSVNVLFYFVSE